MNKWYSSNVERADLDVLAKLCFALNCSVTDILVYNCD
ncbi:MAG: helix-turn-helix transcriptional regulator [Oscillospiraceae bacterium]|nr:helix-turn-helix transcriptional regulator [Oscillospiraceae bacterium]